MQRFTGMTHEVAEFLAHRVFCIFDDTEAGEAQRVTAEEFGLWVKNLPAMLAQTSASARGPVMRGHFNPVAPTPRSRRPSSRPVSVSGDSRPPSQRGMLFPLSTNVEGEFELAEPDLPEEEDVESCSRTTSTARRRKRGARKGKGAQAAITSPESPSGDLLEDLAVASQVLAREISKTSKSSKTSLSPTRAPAAAPLPAKKPSKWKGVFRMNSSDTIAVNLPPPVPFPVPDPSQRQRPAHRDRLAPQTSPPLEGPSATAHNVSTLIMGLSPAPPTPKSEPWARGGRKEPRRTRGSSPWRPDPDAPPLPTSRTVQFERWGGDASHGLSPLGGFDKRDDPGTSPNSTRGRQTPQSTMGASSSNWRTSSSTSSLSGGTTASSAFTRFSNGSVRSVSTVATTVSATPSWRNAPQKDAELAAPPGKKLKPPVLAPPTNVKRQWRVTFR